ncbi:lytic transglycosylase [Streptomyces sp. 150FB]|uniref:transglycosylase SLT domain-containing protein n=1 Tax=Streptomyces sp. 150FB TaxID=1576605 RepID=UPI00058930E9|nr:transglycosylase SLT domain-containing protein [Streptomyces sp. 150FB]KIF73851.1 lytic transglycosylase [Streptomyces sp. 150FB]
MSASRNLGFRHLNKTHKVSIAGIAAVATASLAFSLTPGNAHADSHPQAHAAAASAPATLTTAKGAAPTPHIQQVSKQLTTADVTAKAHAAAVSKAAAKAKAEQKAVAALHAKDDAKAKAHAAAKVKAAAKAKEKAEAAAKKQHAKAVAASRAAAKHAPVYKNNLDGWIKQSLSIMKKHHIPGSYEGLHRNIMRESSGNPNAINGWDINAQNGIPSKGLLQVIPPTFATYHVPGTSKNIYNPVANIVAAANYAADKYGSMDNVNSAY